MSVPESGVAAWIAKADSDMLNIQNNLAAEHVPWDTICFHAQQAAEKLLKAFLVFHGEAPRRSHDLIALLDSCANIDATLTSLQADCQLLTHFAVGIRYPDFLYEPDEADGHEMVAAVERVKMVVLEKLRMR